MASFTILPNHAVTFTVAASDKIATYSLGDYRVDQIVGYPNRPDTVDNVFAGSGANTTAAFSAATEVTISAGDHALLYMTGTGPVIIENAGTTVTALDATGTLTAAATMGGIVTSSTAAAVTATLNTGAAIDAVIDLPVGSYWDWSVINTGGTNSFTVTAAASGHTIVGSGVVVTATSGRYRTIKTAAATYVTYALSRTAS
jgi:hypothetical protein